MGGGSWSADTYDNVSGANIRSGNTFGYTRDSRSRPSSEWRAHESVDPLAVNGPTSPFAGRNIRESRDNPEHPRSTPIAVFFDETGSMGHVPRKLQVDLAKLFGLLVDQRMCTDPQIMIGAYGDAEVDLVPLQAGQFESDNRVDDALNNLFLEGNGGGNGHEHSAFAWYYAATHTDTDNWNKRGKRGYLFTIGDETTGTLPREAIHKHTGDNVEADVTPRQALAMANEQWNVFHIVIDNYVARAQGSIDHYTKLLGGNCITVENLDEIAEIIAVVIGYFEGNFNTGIKVSEGAIRHAHAVGAGRRPELTAY
jgi:hypothetical protein